MADKPGRARLLAIDGVPSRDTQAAIITVKEKCRRADVRAIGVVFVHRGGIVSTLFAGDQDGYFHQLHSGAAVLLRRIAERMQS